MLATQEEGAAITAVGAARTGAAAGAKRNRSSSRSISSRGCRTEHNRRQQQQSLWAALSGPAEPVLSSGTAIIWQQVLPVHVLHPTTLPPFCLMLPAAPKSELHFLAASFHSCRGTAAAVAVASTLNRTITTCCCCRFYFIFPQFYEINSISAAAARKL